MNLLGNSTIKNNTHIRPWIPIKLHKSFFELDTVNVWFALSHQEQLLPWQLCPSYTNTCIIVSVTQCGHWAGEDHTTVKRTRGHKAMISSGRTVEPLLRDTSVLRTSRLIRTLGQVPIHYILCVDVCVTEVGCSVGGTRLGTCGPLYFVLRVWEQQLKRT